MRYSIALILALMSYSAICIDFSEVNTIYWYEKQSVSIRHSIASDENEVHLFLELTGDSVSIDKISYLAQSNYEDANHIEFRNFESSELANEPARVVLELIFTIPSGKNLLVVKYSEPQDDYYFPIPLIRGNTPFPDYYLVDESGYPIFDQFVRQNEYSFEFVGPRKSLWAYEYMEDFPPADPPMGVVQSVSPTLDIDTLVNLENYEMKAGRFYFIQTDTLSNQGFAIYVGESYYPLTRRLEELIPPMTYITRQSEISAVTQSNDAKKAFDDFWLTTYSSSQNARLAIRSYYRKVAMANELFTDYKQGWKTDRGVLTMMFGLPREVIRSNNMETWVYPNDVVFEFRVLSNLFTPNLYVLIRDEDYREDWIRRVRIIRSGGGR